MRSESGLLLTALTASLLLAAPLAMASTVTMTLNVDLSGTTPGSATLQITDIATNEVQVTLTPNFAGTSLQTITGLWLNDPGLTGLTFTAVTPNPNPFVSIAYTSTQTTVPAGTTATVAGQYDTYVKFSNSTPVIRGSSPAEVFDLTSTGGTLNAASFNLTDAAKGAGSPSNIYALIGLTNYSGVAGTGVGFIAATSAMTAVPLPAGLPLLLSGVAGLGLLAGRRKSLSA